MKSYRANIGWNIKGSGDGASLSLAEAKRLAATEQDLDLWHIKALSADIAEALASHTHALSLNGLTTLSPEVARALSQHKGPLSLDGLASLPVTVAEELASLNDALSLNGLRQLTADVAEALRSHKGALSLNGLTNLDRFVAEALSQHEGPLHLNGLEKISPKVAEHLAAHQGDGLYLDGLHALNRATKNTLLQYRGNLSAGKIISRTEHLEHQIARLIHKSSSALGYDALLEQARKELDSLIGLGAVKTEIERLVSFLTVQQLRKEKGLKAAEISRHLVFSGNPGTGKTTVARIVGSIYKAAGFLSSGHTVETDRSSLVAKFIGQTAIKTLKSCKKALGGVLFIDEAYSLAPPDHFGNDFGTEAINTLLKFMEDNREDLVVIVAGYPNKMDAFLNSNPGMQSRFSKTIVFENYTPEELLEILRKMCSEGEYVLSTEAEQAVHAIFVEQCEQADDSFGNARYVRNFYQQALLEHGRRIGALEEPSIEALQTLEAEDFLT